MAAVFYLIVFIITLVAFTLGGAGFWSSLLYSNLFGITAVAIFYKRRTP